MSLYVAPWEPSFHFSRKWSFRGGRSFFTTNDSICCANCGVVIHHCVDSQTLRTLLFCSYTTPVRFCPSLGGPKAGPSREGGSLYLFLFHHDEVMVISMYTRCTVQDQCQTNICKLLQKATASVNWEQQ